MRRSRPPAPASVSLSLLTCSVHTQAVVGGTASSGFIICLLRLATKAALPPTRAGLRTSTGLFFGLSASLCGASYAIYAHVLPRLGVVQHYRQVAAGVAAGWFPACLFCVRLCMPR